MIGALKKISEKPLLPSSFRKKIWARAHSFPSFLFLLGRNIDVFPFTSYRSVLLIARKIGKGPNGWQTDSVKGSTLTGELYCTRSNLRLLARRASKGFWLKNPCWRCGLVVSIVPARSINYLTLITSTPSLPNTRTTGNNGVEVRVSCQLWSVIFRWVAPT